MILQALSLFLGVLVGLDPWRGWLYPVYYSSLRGGRGLASSSVAVMGGSILVTLLMMAPALYASYTHQYVGLLLAVYGGNTLLQGALKLAYPRAHYYGSFRSGLGGMFVWSAVNGAMSGGGLALGCVTLLEISAGAYYFAGYTATFVAMGVVGVASGATLVRHVGVKFDPLLSAIFVALGAYSILYALGLPHVLAWLGVGFAGLPLGLRV